MMGDHHVQFLREGETLTRTMLKQQQFKPLPSEVQVFVLFNGLRERINSKQMRFYETQVAPNLFFGLKGKNLLESYQNLPVNLTTQSLTLFAVTEKLLDNSISEAYKMKKFKIENEIISKGDALCTYTNLVSQSENTFLLNVSQTLVKIAFKYGFMAKKTNKHVDAIFNILSNFNLGK